jgi:hypothetical protein
MKNVFIILGILLFQPVLSQVSLRTNLPHTIDLNRELTFEIRFKKGNITNFSKYQMDLPMGISVSEVNSKTGSFAFEENSAKIVWVITPSEPEFGITLKLSAVPTAQTVSINQKYYYVENDTKKEMEMEPFVITFKDTTMPVVYSAPMVLMPAKTPNALLSSTSLDPKDVSTKKPQEIIQQVEQLRKDSKEAYEKGEREKLDAEQRLADANIAIGKADSIANEEEKKAALAQATTAKQKAEEDLEVAKRVLTLAKTLEENANEIERINQSANPASYTIAPADSTKALVSNSGTETGNSSSNKDIEKLKEAFKEPENKTESTSPVNESGLVYKVQLAALKDKPGKSQFKKFGNVSVVNEDGKYKVLVGSYSAKEDALKKRLEILDQVPGCFVVGYQDGKRIK